MHITAAFQGMEDQIDKLSADLNCCPTPPCEPWFSAKDLLFGGYGEAEDVETIINTSRTFAITLDSQSKISDILKEECSHLLRKSSTALTKASK